MLSILFYLFFIVFTLIYFVVFSIVFFITLPFDPNREVMHVMSRWWTRSYFYIIPRKRMIVEGLENIDKSRAYVIVANHRSMLDIALLYQIPLEFKWVSKKEVYSWPIFGWVLRMHGDITIERGSSSGVKKMLREAGKWLSRGVSVIIFPEGSRGKTDNVEKFKQGAFMMAKHEGVGILPCVMSGTSSAFNGWRINFKNIYHVSVLPQITPEQVSESDVKELTERVQQIMAAEYEKIKIKK